MVPKGWEKKYLKEISVARISNGIFNDPKLVGSGYKLINVVDIYEPREVNTKKLRLLNAEKKEFEKFKVEKGDLFFTRSSLKLAGIAHCARFRADDKDVMWECHIMRVKPNKELVDSDFLYEFSHSCEARKHFMSHAKTGTMTTIDQAGIGSLIVALPPLPEQRKIAKILGTWDKAIATTEKLIEASKQQKKALMQQLLTGKKRFAGFEEEWEEKKLSSLSTLITNGFVGTATPFYTDETGIPYLYGVNVKDNKIIRKNLRYITREFHDRQSKTNLNVGDLLMVQSGHIGETAVVTEEFSNTNCHALIVTKLNQELVCSDFISLYMHSEIGKARLKNLEVGSTIKHINTKDLKKFVVPFPSLREQQKITSVLTTADKEIETLQAKLAHLKQEKKALMQQLLTGKRRVKAEAKDAA